MDRGVIQKQSNTLFINLYSFLHKLNRFSIYSIKDLDVIVPFFSPDMLNPLDKIELTVEIDPFIFCVERFEGLSVLFHE